jgi:hypothetical protein
MRTAFFVQVILAIPIAAVSMTGRSSFAQLAAQGAAQAAAQAAAQGTTQGSAQKAAQGAADECLAKPGGTAPQGSHWYYRVNRADGRHCWYLGPEGQKVRARAREAEPPARAATPKLTPPPAAERPLEPALAETAEGETKSVVADASPEPVVTRVLPEAGPRHPATMTGRSDVEKPAATPATEAEMPLIWPVLSPAELSVAEPASQSKVKWEYVLAGIAGVLALAAMLLGAIFNRAAARERDRDQAAAREEWQASPSVVPRLRIEARRQLEARSQLEVRPHIEVRPQFAETLLAARRAEPLRNSIAAPRRDDGARWPLRPIELSSDPNHDVEASLQRLLHAWQRSAA